MAHLLPLWLLCSAAAWAPALLAGGARASAPDAASLLREGDAAFARGEFSSSIRHYTDAIDADPKQALFFTKRAAAYMSLRQHSSALRDLNAAIAADGGFTQGYLHRGKLQRWAAAARWWQRARRGCGRGRGPDGAACRARPAAGESSAQRAGPRPAHAHLSPHARTPDARARTHNTRRQLCNIAAARSDLDEVLRIKPGHKAALKELEALASLESAMGMLDQLASQPPDAARKAVEMILEAAPDCNKAQVAEAQMEFNQRNYEQVGGGGLI